MKIKSYNENNIIIINKNYFYTKFEKKLNNLNNNII